MRSLILGPDEWVPDLFELILSFVIDQAGLCLVRYGVSLDPSAILP
jgi:hypothetical protein